MLYHVQLSDFVVWNLVFIFVFSPKNADKSGVHPSLLLWYGEGRAPQRAWNRSGLPKTQVKVCCSPCVVAAELHSLPNRYSFCKFYQILWLLSLSRNGLMQLMWRFQFNFVFLSNLSEVNKSLVQTLAPIPVAFVGNECCIIIRITKGPLTGEIRLTFHYDNRF
jgi:hypothetical protein